MNRIECPVCGHQNSPYRSTCFQCDRSLENVPGVDEADSSSLDKSLIVTLGALGGAVLFAVIWFFLFWLLIVEVLFGESDLQLIMFFLITSTMVAVIPGIFLGAALAGHAKNAKGRRQLNWRLGAVAALGFFIGVLLLFTSSILTYEIFMFESKF